MSEKFCFINQKHFFKILRDSEENAVLFCHEDILKGLAIKLYSCGNPQASLEFCGEVSYLFSWNLVQIAQLAIYFFWRQLRKRCQTNVCLLILISEISDLAA